MFDSIINGTLTPASFFICLGTALILGLVVAFTHKFTFFRATGHPASPSMVTTLAVLPILVSAAIMLVNGNLGTGVAVMGIFALVRFRSIPGNSRSLLSVFFSMVIGLAVGTGYVAFAVIFTVVTAVLLLIYSAFSFGNHQSSEQVLTILVPEDLDYSDLFDDLFKKYTTSSTLVKTKTTNLGSLFELKYRVILKKSVKEKEFIDKLRTRNGNLKIALSHELLEEEL